MKTYKVITTCTFQNRYLEVGTIVEYPSDVEVPRHLELVKDKTVKPEVKEKEGTFSGMQEAQQSLNKPKSGFSQNVIQEPKKSESQKESPKKEKV